MNESNEPPAGEPPPQYDWTNPPEPVRRSAGTSDGLGALIPAKNPPALIAYYCAVFALIPCVGLALGPVAVVLGIVGLRKIAADPSLPGKGHAWIGIVLGGLVALAHIVLIALIIIEVIRSP